MFAIIPLDDNCVPKRAHLGDAGVDLIAAEAVTIGPGEAKPIRMGIKTEIPLGFVGLIFPRSGLATKKRVTLTNTVGVIDSGYRGEIICHMTNNGSFQYTVDKYDRIAQLVVVPCLISEFLELEEDNMSESSRGEGGFGHTGDN